VTWLWNDLKLQIFHLRYSMSQ